MSAPIPHGQPLPGTPEAAAQNKIQKACIELMMGDGIAPHIIAGALLTNLILVLCSASPDIGIAHKALDEAIAMLNVYKKLVPGILRTVRTAQHAATASGAAASMASGKVQ